MREPAPWTTRWTLDAPCDDVWAALSDLREMPRWWPAMWRSVEELPRDADTALPMVSAEVRGATPVTYAFSARCELHDGRAMRWALVGDLEGVFEARVEAAEGDRCAVLWTWRVRCDQPSLRDIPLVADVLALDLAWAHARGLTSLRHELARRRGEDPPAPPAPAGESTLPWTLAVAGVTAAVLGLVGLLVRRRTW